MMIILQFALKINSKNKNKISWMKMQFTNVQLNEFFFSVEKTSR